MKLFQFAIASIVDSNTGQGLSHDHRRIDYQAAEVNARRLRAESFRNYLQRLRNGINVALTVIRERRAMKRSLRDLSALSDHMLGDIGFTRGDISAAENGYIDQAQLELRRFQNRDSRSTQQRNAIAATSTIEQKNALNDAVFASSKCA